MSDLALRVVALFIFVAGSVTVRVLVGESADGLALALASMAAMVFPSVRMPGEKKEKNNAE